MTWWDDPPPQPTAGEVLPGWVAMQVVSDAIQNGRMDIIEMVGMPAESKVLGSWRGGNFGPGGTPSIIIDDGSRKPGVLSPFDVAKGFVKDGKKKKRKAAKPTLLSNADLPPTTIALLFPGQGSQSVGMVGKMADNEVVQGYYAMAHRILGYDIQELCRKGPEEKLEETSVCQPAIYIANLAAMEQLKTVNPDAASRPGAVAGLSLGEYSALCVAGVFTFEEGLELVKVRGEAMAAAARLRPQAMLSVAGLDQDVLERLCRDENKGDEICSIANVLFPKGFACAGSRKAIDNLKAAAEKAGAMQAKILKTGGGFHTKLMASAQEKLEKALNQALPNMKPPRCDVYMNATAERIPKGTDPKVIVPLLAKQLCNSVLWEPSVRAMIGAGLNEFYEVGPQKQLRAMMKRIDVGMWGSTTNVEV